MKQSQRSKKANKNGLPGAAAAIEAPAGETAFEGATAPPGAENEASPQAPELENAELENAELENAELENAEFDEVALEVIQEIPAEAGDEQVDDEGYIVCSPRPGREQKLWESHYHGTSVMGSAKPSAKELRAIQLQLCWRRQSDGSRDANCPCHINGTGNRGNYAYKPEKVKKTKADDAYRLVSEHHGTETTVSKLDEAHIRTARKTLCPTRDAKGALDHFCPCRNQVTKIHRLVTVDSEQLKWLGGLKVMLNVTVMA